MVLVSFEDTVMVVEFMLQTWQDKEMLRELCTSM